MMNPLTPEEAPAGVLPVAPDMPVAAPQTAPTVTDDPPVVPDSQPGVVTRWWNAIKKKAKDERKSDNETIAAVGRGATGAVIQTGRTIAEGAAWFDRTTGLGEVIEPGYNAAYDEAGGARGIAEGAVAPAVAAQNAVFGRRSDDRVTQFVEDTTQFVTAFVAAGSLRAVAGAAKVSEAGYLVSSVARGAAVDVVAFDPYEAQFAELVQSWNVPGLSDAAELLSVEGDDSALVARIKRATAGAVVGTAIDGLIWSARALRARRVLQKADATAAQRVEATALEQEAMDVLESIQNGTSRSAEPITVVAREDGTFTLTKTADETRVPEAADPVVKPEAEEPAPVYSNRAEAEAQADAMNRTIGEDEPRGPLPTADEIRAEMEARFTAKAEIDDEFYEEMTTRHLGNMNLEEATTLLTTLSHDATIQSAVASMAEQHGRNLGRRIATLDILMENRPHDPLVREEAVRRLSEVLAFQDFRTWLVGDQGRALRLRRSAESRATGYGRKARETVGPDGKMLPNGATVSLPSRLVDVVPTPPGASVPGVPGAAIPGTVPGAAAVGVPQPSLIAGMATRNASIAALTNANLRHMTRVFRLAQGNPANVTAAIQAAVIVMQTGKTEKLLEIFTNAILSNPVTHFTIFGSGQVMGAWEAGNRALAGALNGNQALQDEGLDILQGLYTNLAENWKVARLALNEGQSIINPAPAYRGVAGIAGEIVRIPGHIALAADEFTRVSNYRAFIGAKSRREGRLLGLAGAALDAKVVRDQAASFDPRTGIATVPEALQYAERATLSGPLGMDTFGGSIQKLLADNPKLQFLAPFIKASTNIFRTVTQNTPLLARLNDEAQEIMQKGGEEAAVLQTKQMVATAFYAAAGLAALSGRITGDAPADPALRASWGRQPYSVLIGDTWVSYRRTDPFGVMIGLMADIVQFADAATEVDPDILDLGFALVSATASSVLTPTHMRGISDFMEVLDSGDPKKWQKWTSTIGASFVPNVGGALNPDQYLREVRTMADAVKTKIPGLSETLDPRFNILGEPIMNGGNRTKVNPFRTMQNSGPVFDELTRLGKGFQPFSTRTSNGINLADREAFDNGTGVSPYRRLMHLIEHPESGPNLREAMEMEIRSPGYATMSEGTSVYRGGRKWERLARVRKQAYDRAFSQVRSEYPKLADETRLQDHEESAAKRGGQEAVDRLRETNGTPVQDKSVLRFLRTR